LQSATLEKCLQISQMAMKQNWKTKSTKGRNEEKASHGLSALQVITPSMQLKRNRNP